MSTQSDPSPAIAPRTPQLLLSRIPARLPWWGGWSLLAGLLVIEFLLFRHYLRREVLWTYPPNTDQVGYLADAYDTYQLMRTQGVVRAIEVLPPIPQGALMRIHSGLFFLLAGASRASALELNFLYFSLLQCAIVWAVRWLTGRWDVAWMGLGLLLCAGTPFLGPGGIADFRIDFIAFCLYGVLLCVVIRSGVLADWRWAPAVALVAAVLIGFRFIATAYVGGVMGALGLLFVVRSFARDANVRVASRRRLGTSALTGAIVALLVAPLLWANRQAIRDYYWVNHVTGAEKDVRAAAEGASEWGAALAYYPNSLLRWHAGLAFDALAGALLIGAGIVRVAVRDSCSFDGTAVTGPNGSARERTAMPAVAERGFSGLGNCPLSLAWFASGAFLVVPLVALTLDVSKSPVVAGIMVGPLVWMVILGIVSLLRGRFPVRPSARAVALGLGAIVSVGWGIRTQATAYSHDRFMSQHRRDAMEVERLFDDMARASQRRGWSRVGVFCSSITDYLDGQIATVLTFERRGYALHVDDLTPTVLQMPEAGVFRQVAASHFVILARRLGPPPAYDYPFNTELEAMFPRVEAACDRDMMEIGRYRIYDQEVRLYVRPMKH